MTEPAWTFRVETKGLYELSDVIYCLARIRSLTTAEWAALSEDEAAAANQLIEEMTSTEKAITAGLAARETKTATPPTTKSESPPEGSKSDGFDALLAAAKSLDKLDQTAEAAHLLEEIIARHASSAAAAEARQRLQTIRKAK